ncbi:MAG: copper resistance protein CopC [Actinomycetota bacterium]|nr:copper resistance protein CopC [Actinomycetota bacterium]
MIPRKLVIACGAVALLAWAAPAGAHGDIQASDPEPGSRVIVAPESVAVTFTEAPTAEAVLRVRDGCRRDVTGGVSVADATATVRVQGGEPGTWRVSYRVISSLDGHETRGGYAFAVAGKRDCGPPDEPTDAPPTDGPGDGDAAAPGDGAAAESGAPVIPIALGAVAVVAVAFIVRRSGS